MGLTLLLLLGCAAPPPSPPEAPRQVSGGLRTVLVWGGGQPADPALRLDGADVDVTAVSSALAGRGWQVTRVRDRSPAGLLAALRALTARLRDEPPADHEVIVYASAHGVRAAGPDREVQSWLLGAASRAIDPVGTGLALDDLLGAIAATGANGTLLTDACHAAALRLPASTALLSPSGPEGVADGTPERGGRWTGCLLDALQGAPDLDGDGARSLLEAHLGVTACLGRPGWVQAGEGWLDPVLGSPARPATGGIAVADALSGGAVVRGSALAPGEGMGLPVGLAEARDAAGESLARFDVRPADRLLIRRDEDGRVRAFAPRPPASLTFVEDDLAVPGACGEAAGMVITDVDGDGSADLLALSTSCPPRLLLDIGAPQPEVRAVAGPAGLQSLTVGDLDLDGKIDLAGLGAGGNVEVRLDLLGASRRPARMPSLPAAPPLALRGALLLPSLGGVPAVLRFGRGGPILEAVRDVPVDFVATEATAWPGGALLGGSELAALRQVGGWRLDRLSDGGAPALMGGAFPVDLDADGRLDVLVVDAGPDGVAATRALPGAPGRWGDLDLPGIRLSFRATAVPLDADGDGRTDVFAPTGGSWRGLPAWQLFLAGPDGHVDVARAVGLGDHENVQVALVADIDLDGDADLLVMERGGRLRRYRNGLDPAAPLRVHLSGPALGATIRLVGGARPMTRLTGPADLRGAPWGEQADVVLPLPSSVLPLWAEVEWADGRRSRQAVGGDEVSLTPGTQPLLVHAGRALVDLASGAVEPLALPAGRVEWWARGRAYGREPRQTGWWLAAPGGVPLAGPPGCAWPSLLPVGLLTACEPASGPVIRLDGQAVLPGFAEDLLRAGVAIGDHAWLSFNGERTIRAVHLPDLTPVPARDVPNRPGDAGRREWLRPLPEGRLLAVDAESPPALEIWDVTGPPRFDHLIEGIGEEPMDPRWDAGRIVFLTRFAVESVRLDGSDHRRVRLPMRGESLRLLGRDDLAVVSGGATPTSLFLVDLAHMVLLDEIALPSELSGQGLEVVSELGEGRGSAERASP